MRSASSKSWTIISTPGSHRGGLPRILARSTWRRTNRDGAQKGVGRVEARTLRVAGRCLGIGTLEPEHGSGANRRWRSSGRSPRRPRRGHWFECFPRGAGLSDYGCDALIGRACADVRAKTFAEVPDPPFRDQLAAGGRLSRTRSGRVSRPGVGLAASGNAPLACSCGVGPRARAGGWPQPPLAPPGRPAAPACTRPRFKKHNNLPFTPLTGESSLLAAWY